MTGTTAAQWKTIIGSASIMSVALLGDALLYAVLPVYAESFGLTLPWVGVMLSANRLVRVFAYGLIARLTQKTGIKRMAVAAAVIATLSTTLYGFTNGPFAMLIARVLWGVTYAILVLVTLSYAMESRTNVGARVGVSQAIQRSGPVLALFGGAWLVSIVGPNNVFLILALPTALAIPLALSLPEPSLKTNNTTASKSMSLAKPTPIDVIFFLQGYGVDGVFAISITLIFAREATLSEAVLSGSALLAMRHFGEAIGAPLFGWIADKFGARQVFLIAVLLTLFGFALVAAGLTVIGALVMLLFRGALASLGPAVIAESLNADQDALGPLARMQAWRDLGASCGPLFTGFLLTVISAEVQHGMVAIGLICGLFYWWLKEQTGWP